MAVIDSLKRLFVVEEALPPQIVIPSRALSYTVHPLTVDDLHELVPLNLRCFKNGENYTWNTFKYLLSEPNALAYKVVADTSEMAGFVCVLVGETSTAASHDDRYRTRTPPTRFGSDASNSAR